MEMRKWQPPRDCGLVHTKKVDGTWQIPVALEELYGLVQRNGRVVFYLRCQDCDAHSGALPTWLLKARGFTWADVKHWRQNDLATPQDYEPCAYEGCGTTPTELHHFAPYNTFSSDADNWPRHSLCREHHQEWHRTMDGYRWHKKRSA